MKYWISTSCVALALTPCLPVGAEPRSAVWLEDPSVEPARETETAAVYEHQLTDWKAAGAGIDTLTLRLHAGLGSGMEAVPVLRLQQRGPEPLRLRSVGVLARGRVLGEGKGPQTVTLYGGYESDTSDARDHLLQLGAAGRHRGQRYLLGADLRLSAAMGGEKDSSTELWLGASGGYVFLEESQLSAGLEVFWIRPLVGDRLSDSTFGLSAGSATFYYGPSISGKVGPVWTGLSAVTGFFVSDPASQVMVRWWVGVAH